MAATGKTPILLYGSTTATNTPVAGNLTNSSDGCEIAINVADKNLFFKDDTNAVNTVPIRQSSGSSDGWLSSTNWTTFNSKQTAYTNLTSIGGLANATGWLYNNGSGTFSYSTPSKSDVGLGNVTNDAQTKAAIVPNTAPSTGQLLVGNAGGTAYAPVSMSSDMTLSSTGAATLATVNSNVGSYTYANITVNAKGLITAASSGTAPVTSVSGTLPISSSGGTTPAISISQATTSTNGYLSSTDWNTFNNKQPAGTYVTSVTGTAPVVSSGGTTPAISMAAATGSVNGYLTSTDWTTFNNKQNALVSGTNIKSLGGTSLLGSGDITTLTLSGTFQAGNVKLDTNTISTTNTNGNLTLSPNGTGYVALGGATPRILLQDTGTYTAQIRTLSGNAIFGSTNNTPVLLQTSGTTKITINSADSNVKLESGNLIIGTSGKGIDFSATSDGSGTMTSELLADYEEGTWTPTQGVGLTVVGTFSSSGTYTKVGRLVTVTANLNATTSIVASAGGIACGSLPYTVSGAHVGSLTTNALTQSSSASAYGTNIYSSSATTAATGLVITVTYMV